MVGETALSIVNNAFFRAATGRNDSILTTYVVLPSSEYLPKIPPTAVGFQTFLVRAFVPLSRLSTPQRDVHVFYSRMLRLFRFFVPQIPLFTSLMLPLFVSFVSFEKEALLTHMMRMAGMTDLAYWLGSGFFCFFLSFKTTIWLYAFAFLFGVSTFTNSYFPLFFVLALLWGLATTGYAFFLGAVSS